MWPKVNKKQQILYIPCEIGGEFIPNQFSKSVNHVSQSKHFLAKQYNDKANEGSQQGQGVYNKALTPGEQ